MNKVISFNFQLISIVLVAQVLVVAAKKDEDVRQSAVCSTDSQELVLDCGDTARIEVETGYYAHDNEDRHCLPGGPHWESNTCLHNSRGLRTKLEGLCNGRSKCRVSSAAYAVSLFNNPNVLGAKEEIPPSWHDCSLDKSKLISGPDNTYRRNMVGARYKCIHYEFCKKLDNTVSSLIMATKDYPALSVTNPTCGCTFKSTEPGSLYLKIYILCQGNVTIMATETYSDHTSADKEYFCTTATDLIEIGTEEQPSEIKFTVDPYRSSEHSGYRASLSSWYVSSQLRKKPADVIVSCVAGKLFLPYSTQLGLMIGLPLATILIIAFIALYCILKKRRLRAKTWRTANIRLRQKRRQKTTPGASISTSRPTESECPPSPEADSLKKERFGKELSRKMREGRGKEIRPETNIPASEDIPAGLQYAASSILLPSRISTPAEKPLISKKPAGPSRNTSKHSMREIEPAPIDSPFSDERSGRYNDEPYKHYDDEQRVRYDPEGNDDDEPEEMDDLIRMLHRKNEGIKQAAMDKRYGYSAHNSPSHSRRHLDAPIQNRAQSWTNISHRHRRNKEPPSTLPISITQPTLAGTRSASNSRTSLRSMKRRAPPPPNLHHTIGAPEGSRHPLSEMYPTQPVARHPSNLSQPPESILPADSNYATPRRLGSRPSDSTIPALDEETEIMRSPRPQLPPKTSRRRPNLPAGPPTKPQRRLHYNDSLDSPGSEPISF